MFLKEEKCKINSNFQDKTEPNEDTKKETVGQSIKTLCRCALSVGSCSHSWESGNLRTQFPVGLNPEEEKKSEICHKKSLPAFSPQKNWGLHKIPKYIPENSDGGKKNYFFSNYACRRAVVRCKQDNCTQLNFLSGLSRHTARSTKEFVTESRCIESTMGICTAHARVRVHNRQM